MVNSYSLEKEKVVSNKQYYGLSFPTKKKKKKLKFLPKKKTLLKLR